MNFRFTIGKKIGTGFGVLIVLTIFTFIFTNKTLNKSKKINAEINNIYKPSVDALQELKTLTFRSRLLIYTWVNTSTATENSPDKQKLINLVKNSFPDIKERILKLSKHWAPSEKKKAKDLFEDYDKLFKQQAYVRQLLPNFESYNDPQARFLAGSEVVEGGDIYVQTNRILLQLNNLINTQKFKTQKVSEQMLKSFSLLQFLERYLGIGLVIGGILIAIYTTRSIVTPIQELKKVLLSMGKGVFPDHNIKKRSDEIGQMIVAMDNLIDGLKSTKDFAEQVGSGNFSSHYKPLSENDALGQALLKMRNDLAINEKELEDKVKQRTAEVVKQKEEIEHQSLQITNLYEQVTDSIKYAKHLQDAILPPKSIVDKYLGEAFILFRPKDIVSGDFYWMENNKNGTYFSAVDCTGHGVPGAFMSIVGHNILNQAAAEAKNGKPSEILDLLNKGITKTLHQKDKNGSRDGMDLAMCKIDRENELIQFSGANNPLYIVRNNEIQEIKANKFPIGSYNEGEKKDFTNHEIKIHKGDMIYISSDGYADQFGGPNGKKFMYKQFRDTLTKIATLDVEKQKEILNTTIEKWMGEQEQIDDILIIGVKI